MKDSIAFHCQLHYKKNIFSRSRQSADPLATSLKAQDFQVRLLQKILQFLPQALANIKIRVIVSGLHHDHRGPPVGRVEHGPRGLRPGRGQQEVHISQGEHKLSVLQ